MQARLEAQGDRYWARGAAAKALEKYRSAEALGEASAALYEKLIRTHTAVTTDWTARDLSESLDWEMRRQALDHPAVALTHARLAPEWQEITERLRRLAVVQEAAMLERLIHEILAYRERALVPLLDFILVMLGKSPPGMSASEEAPT